MGNTLNTSDDLLLKYSNLGNSSEVKNLLDLDIESNIHPDNISKALFESSMYGHLEVVKVLLQHKVDINNFGDLALTGAAMNGHLEIVKLLIENKANIGDNQALYAATQNGHLEVIKYLLDNKADVFNGVALSYALKYENSLHRRCCFTIPPV